MEQIGTMKFYTFDEVVDEQIGEKGTQKREEFDRRVDEAVSAYKIGEAIKAERIRQNLTQEELGERLGVKKAQISRLENGHSITLATMSRVFKALGINTASVDLGVGGRVALW